MYPVVNHCSVLILFSGGADDHIFETKTVALGHNVTLTCPRNRSGRSTSLFWIRLVSQTFPEVLGGTINYDLEAVDVMNHITAKQEPGTFVLHIPKTQLSDTAIYYCIKVIQSKIIFVKGVFLRITVRPEDPVTLQCSVLSDSEKKKCPGNHSVFWFRAGSGESHPSLIYTHGNSGDECEKSPEAHSPQKCVYNFSKNISSSDAGTYYCAVASCGEILFGNGTKLDIEVVGPSESQKENTILYLVCAALAINLIVIAFLVYAIVKKSCHCNAAVSPQTNAATASGDQQSQQINEDSLVYYRPDFTRRKAGKSGRRSARNAETIYTDVRAFVID
uniref:Ig-like domain-containing protein n=1 Tax=Dicentrarchus labrax TaxID=13489 RepID=A0A8P4G509_DICLA